MRKGGNVQVVDPIVTEDSHSVGTGNHRSLPQVRGHPGKRTMGWLDDEKEVIWSRADSLFWSNDLERWVKGLNFKEDGVLLVIAVYCCFVKVGGICLSLQRSDLLLALNVWVVIWLC